MDVCLQGYGSLRNQLVESQQGLLYNKMVFRQSDFMFVSCRVDDESESQSGWQIAAAAPFKSPLWHPAMMGDMDLPLHLPSLRSNSLRDRSDLVRRLQ